MGGIKMQDGSVILVHDGMLLKPILKYTGSNLVHAAVVLFVNGQPYGYEATWPRVRRLPWDEFQAYLTTNCQRYLRHGAGWVILQPKVVFTVGQLTAMKAFANSQLGRRYMLRGWWEQHEVRGTHCSQYVGNVLEKSGLITSANYRESPGSLCQKIQPFYEET